MPIISAYFGIIIRMRHGDHAPPHVHVEYQGYRALVAISTGEVGAGRLPSKAAAIVREWCLTHQAELSQNWILAQAFEPLNRIQGADHD
jgi:hypothetical protein